MNLPNASAASVGEGKIKDYLLAFGHPEGASKAAFFSRFGFKVDHWEILASALCQHAATHPISSTTQSIYGIKYNIEGPLATPDGRFPLIRAVWLIDKDASVPRLITAYPI